MGVQLEKNIFWYHLICILQNGLHWKINPIHNTVHFCLQLACQRYRSPPRSCIHCCTMSSYARSTRRGRASCGLWYAPVTNICDLLLFLDENRAIPEFRHFWNVTSPDEELLTVLYFPSDAFPMTWPRNLFTGLNSTGMKVTWLRTLASTRP